MSETEPAVPHASPASQNAAAPQPAPAQLDGEGEPPIPDVPAKPPLSLSPASWNALYFSILGGSFLLGFLSLLNGHTLYMALFIFFVALVTLFLLTVGFVSFIVIPLQVRHYQRLVDAVRRQAEAELRSRMRKAEEDSLAMREERMGLMGGQGLDLSSAFMHRELDERDVEFREPTTGSHPNGAGPSRDGVADQAASLRKMMAGIETR